MKKTGEDVTKSPVRGARTGCANPNDRDRAQDPTAFWFDAVGLVRREERVHGADQGRNPSGAERLGQMPNRNLGPRSSAFRRAGKRVWRSAIRKQPLPIGQETSRAFPRAAPLGAPCATAAWLPSWRFRPVGVVSSSPRRSEDSCLEIGDHASRTEHGDPGEERRHCRRARHRG
jgi:hypothetical protein